MRQLLPQISVPRSPREYAYGQMQNAPSASYMPYSSGAASVFVPCNDPQPLQDMYKGQPAWGFEHELLSAGSIASSGADGCVPELTQGSLSHVIVKSEACVPDYNTSGDGSPCMPPIQKPIIGLDGHMQPRVAFLKLDEDSFSSDSEDRLTLKLQPSDAMPLIASGKLSNLSLEPYIYSHGP
ncbi:g6214 [Coccomyxa viridis]|uniref:G6214 protein n=1 Tax=Coccomyxa viridis TaxID=1274662 RepID=A0ABP1FUV2_9CHLO